MLSPSELHGDVGESDYLNNIWVLSRRRERMDASRQSVLLPCHVRHFGMHGPSLGCGVRWMWVQFLVKLGQPSDLDQTT